MEEIEKKLLNPQWAKNKGKRRLYLLLLSLGAFLSYSLLLFVFFLLNREIKQRKLVEQNLANYQENLRNLASQLSLAEEREDGGWLFFFMIKSATLWLSLIFDWEKLWKPPQKIRLWCCNLTFRWCVP
jgi:hypothetical protein